MKFRSQNGSILLEGSIALPVIWISSLLLLILIWKFALRAGDDYQRFQRARHNLNGKTISPEVPL